MVAMVKRLGFGFAAMALVVFGFSCSSNSSKKVDGAVKSAMESGLTSQQDSLSYVVGLSIAQQLQGMDSTLNLNAVCRAILERSSGKAVMSDEEAKIAYLRYMLYVEPERKRGYEEQFLADLVKGDRTYTRTKSGLTYNIEAIGEERSAAKNNNDWVVMSCKIVATDGTQIYPKADDANAVDGRATIEMGVGDMVAGLAESVKLVGPKGRIKAWMPSKIAYGEDGSEELGIAPLTTVMYDIEVVNVVTNAARARKQNPNRF